jgi:hypothetical protein
MLCHAFRKEVTMKRRFDPVILALLIVSLAANLVIYRYTRPVQAAQPPPLKAGDKLPPLRGTSLDGRPITETFARRTVLYIFSPTCSWCERNLNNARAIAGGAGSRYQFVAVSTTDTGLEDYVRSRHVQWTIIKNVTFENLRSYRFKGTPHTIFVDAGGVVLGSWSGAYTDSVEHEVQAALGVALPGLLR